MKAYKGFRRDMTCRDFQYEEGKSYETDKVKCCSTGFHACENPVDCLFYYDPYHGAVFHEVELEGDFDSDDFGTKIAATKITVGARLTIAGLAKAAIDFRMRRVKPGNEEDGSHGSVSATDNFSVAGISGDDSVASVRGDYSAASATGDRSVANATGHKSAANVTGNRSVASVTSPFSVAGTMGCFSVASATGDKSVVSATGRNSVATATNRNSIISVTGRSSVACSTGDFSVVSAENETAVAVAWGIHGKAKGVKGAYLIFADWRLNKNYDWYLHGAKMVRIDGEKYKADTWYEISGGKVVESFSQK